MADFNPIFEVDAAKILAKLHLAGLQQANNCIVINTAIKNPDKGATPENPGSVEFDLENKTGVYQLAVIRPLEYLVPIDPTKNDEYVKAKEELDKFMKDHEKDLPEQPEAGKDEKTAGKKDEKNEKDSKESKDKAQDDKNKKTSLTDPKAKEKTKVEDSLKIKSFLEYITEADDKDKDKGDPKLLELLEKLQEAMLEVYDSYGMKEYKKVEGKDKKPNYAESAKAFEEALTKINEQRVEDKKKLTEECKKAALGDLKTYFINFAGKDNQAKIKDADIVVKNATADGHMSEPKEMEENIKDYVIEVDEVDEEILKNQEELLNKPKEIYEKPYAHDVALVVGYKIDIE